ncbi:UNVERIFIED_CONTAM: hypothetical protein Slati_3805700 [Sesamum latifolium]|uniref:Uncharacterized protein n=1 Tax=Sesamum latifolium TaxID=2727402 RepID=A0AAW2U5H4_9LAMI
MSTPRTRKNIFKPIIRSVLPVHDNRDDSGPALNEHLLEACWGPSRASSRHLKGVFRVPERYENRTGEAAERFRLTCKVAPRTVKIWGYTYRANG